MRRSVARLLAATLIATLGAALLAQAPARRLATVAALRQFPGYFHLQNVLLRGEFTEAAGGMTLSAGDQEIRVLLSEGVTTSDGPAEVRGRLMDVGRLEPGDPRISALGVDRDAERWPKPGEELVVAVTGVTSAQVLTQPSVRALALEPWRFENQKVTLVGQFRGRNLFGDLPAAPAVSRYDFVLRSADAAIWVTGLRPRGRGFELLVDARVDTSRWVQVTGTVGMFRGLGVVQGDSIMEAEAPASTPRDEEPAAAEPPRQPVEVVFSSPTRDETDVPGTTVVRLQFSRGLNPATIADHIRVSYVGGGVDAALEAAPEFKHSYDAATRAVEIRFTRPLTSDRTVRVQLIEGIMGFDGSSFVPWTLTFSTGS